MREIYLARHGEPAFPEANSCCLGKEDLPLSGKGMRQALELRDFFASKDLAVYSSPLSCSFNTALLVAGSKITVRPEFAEIPSGFWEGKSFSGIELDFGKIDSFRGIDTCYAAPQEGESHNACAERASHALTKILAETDKDILLVAPASVNRSLLCLFSGSKEPLGIPQPYGAISVLSDDSGTVKVMSNGELPESSISLPRPQASPTRRECFAIHIKRKLPANIIRHCSAVASLALEMAFGLLMSGYYLDTALIEAASLLHDIERLEKDHATRGADLINGIGYPAVAAAIATHMDLPVEHGDIINEKSLVYLADKLVLEDKRVPLENRYIRNPADTESAKAASERLEQARKLLGKFMRLSGMQIYDLI
ncbi:MAG: histidine phosphatase family protein [Eubacteriaceae bacterium]|nr:histidine phosphatase family protein [Eubacteriaceae bacterium]